MEPLKEMFNAAYFKKLALELKSVDKRFPDKKFLSAILPELEPLSLNQRMRRASEILHTCLSGVYPEDLPILKQVVRKMPRGYTSLLFPDYVSAFGKQHFDLSLDALKYFTSFGSSEFAIREFLKADFKYTIKVMENWAVDSDHHVRRLASEGSRPRLPWSFKLQAVINDPSSTKKILETLKDDPELYVRKSVANHLNDITKDNPEFMLSLIKGWNKNNPHTAWIIRHASRSLIKQGHAVSLSVFDFEKNPKLRLANFKILTPKLQLGENLSFQFDLHSEKNTGQKLVVDYIIHYQKKSGTLAPKVFKLKELVLEPGNKASLTKKQTIKDFTTRKHFPGKHLLELQVNGKVIAKKPFYLEC